MNKILLLLTCLIMCAMASCEKEQQRIITGAIIDKTTGEPIKNNDYKLHVSGSRTSSTFSEEPNIRSYRFSTDSMGNFEVMFECTSKESLAISYPDYDYYENDKWLWSGRVNKDDMLIGVGTIKADSL